MYKISNCACLLAACVLLMTWAAAAEPQLQATEVQLKPEVFHVTPDGKPHLVYFGEVSQLLGAESPLKPTASPAVSSPPAGIAAFPAVAAAVDNNYELDGLGCTSDPAPTVAAATAPSYGSISSVVVPYVIPAGYNCAGTTVQLTVLQYTWTAKTKLPMVATDSFSATWTYAAVYPPATLPYSTWRAPEIVHDANEKVQNARIVWFFGNDSSGNLRTTPVYYNGYLTLDAYASTGAGTYTWQFASGSAYAQFYDPTTKAWGQETLTTTVPYVEVYGTGPSQSSALKDVQVTVTLSNFPKSPSAQYEMATLEPTTNIEQGSSPACGPYLPPGATQAGYTCKISFITADQFGAALPWSLQINENWPPVAPVDVGTNWPTENPQPCGGKQCPFQTPGAWFDVIDQAAAGKNGLVLVPPATEPQTSGPYTFVEFTVGGWYVGSGSPGIGLELSQNEWDIYADHGEEPCISSPVGAGQC